MTQSERPKEPEGRRKPRIEQPPVHELSALVVGDLPARVEVLGAPLLAVGPGGVPVNHKASLFLPKKDLLPFAILSSSPEHHGVCNEQAAPALEKAMKEVGFTGSLDDFKAGLFDQDAQVYVPLVITGRGGNTRVTIRPDFRGYGQYLRAIYLLREPPLSIPPERICFERVIEPEVRDVVKCIGCMHMVDPLNLDERNSSVIVRNSKRTSVAGNRFFASERVNYMSIQHLRDVLSDINDREKFQGRLEEIVGLYQERPLLPTIGEGAVRQLDFLLLDKEGNLNPDTEFIFEGLRAIAQESKSAGEWTPKVQADIQKKFNVVLSKFARKNNPDFNEIDLRDINPDVLNPLYCIVRNVPSEADVMKLGTEFRGHLRPRPGGYITGGESNLEYTSGLDVPVQELPDGMRKVLRAKQAENPTAEYVVLRPEDVEGEESVHTFRVKNVPEGRVTWRHWVFDEQADSPTKDLLNKILSDHPDLRYAYACSVPESRSRRDSLASEIKMFGMPVREVNIPVYMTEGGKELKMLDRRVKWNAQLFTPGLPLEQAVEIAKSYEFYLADRVSCIQQLCPNACLPAWSIYHTHVDVDGVKVPIAHGVREYVDGLPTNRLPLRLYRNVNPVKKLVACKGRLAAANMILGRELFDDGDEVVSEVDETGNPVQLRLTDPTTSFNDVDTPLADCVGLYACSLAQDMVKHNIGESMWSRFFKDTLLISSEFYAAFAKEFVSIQNGYRQNREHFDKLVNQRIVKDFDMAEAAGDDMAVRARLNPEYPTWRMRDKWPKVLKRLDESDVNEILDSLKAVTQRVYATGLRAVHELSRSEQTLVVELFTRTLSMNHRSVDQLLDTINHDSEFDSLSFDERMQRLNAMRVSSWIHMVGHSPQSIRNHARKCLKGRSMEEARGTFKETVNEEFFKLHLSEEHADIFFDLVKNPDLADKLERKGYML